MYDLLLAFLSDANYHSRLIPTVFLPLSLLSYASILGIVSTVLIIAVVFVDGFTKRDTPGSLWSPADTSLEVKNLSELGIAFGLFMAGFSGHAVIPSLAKDMINPLEFDRMINWAFVSPGDSFLLNFHLSRLNADCCNFPVCCYWMRRISYVW
jgi:hypothetical protein